MKRSELGFAITSVFLDFSMIIVAAMVAYSVRFESYFTQFRPAVYAIPFQEYLRVVVFIALGWILIFSISGLYAIHEQKKLILQVPKIILACSTGILAVILLIFFRKEELFSSRFIVLAMWALSILFLIVGRGILNIARRILYTKNIGVHRVVVIGNDKTTNLIIDSVRKSPQGGYSLIKHLKTAHNGSMQELFTLFVKGAVDDLFVADGTISKATMLELKELCDEYHVAFRYSADLFDAQATNLEITTINNVPIIEIKKTPLDGWGSIAKRIFDILGASIGILLVSPLMIIAAGAIRIEGKGPIIYKNERVKKDGTFFTWKFRSMKAGYCTGKQFHDNPEAAHYEEALIKEKNERRGPVYKVLNDPRRTRVGRFLEKTSIDELPQFFNVLFGSMSLVGPRPHQVREVAKYERRHKKLFSVKPGITGLSQISGRSDLDFEDEAKLDLYYIENWSLWLDLSILFKTPFTLFQKRKQV